MKYDGGFPKGPAPLIEGAITMKRICTALVTGLVALLIGVSPMAAQISPVYHPSTAPLAPILVIPNASATGTTTAYLAKLTGVNTVVLPATTDNKNGVIVGVVVAGGGTSGSATLLQTGVASCSFDGNITQNDFVTVSTSTAGDCHDDGSTMPTDGTQVLGRVASPTNAGGAAIYLALFNITPANTGIAENLAENCGATSTGTQNCAKAIVPAAIAVFGNVTLNGTASQAITGLPFSSSTSYTCTGNEYTAAAGKVNFPTITSGSSITIQETGGGTSDVLYYACIGN